jgi:hypothetical protein
MDGVWLARLRWRRRGAWLWPAFVAMTVVDGVIGHLLPLAGDRQSVVAGALAALVLNLIGVILLSRPLGIALRRARTDLPAMVARNYAGTGVVLAITVVLLAVGLLHHSSVLAGRRMMQDAVARAQAWIGDHAPAEFRRNVGLLSTYAIQSGIYRACAMSDDHARTYCVIVKTSLPFARSVTFAGYEPNSVFSQGTN